MQALCKSVRTFLRTLGLEVPFKPAIPLLGIVQENLKMTSHSDAYAPMFISAQTVIVKSWKQPACPLTAEWIKIMWHF